MAVAAVLLCTLTTVPPAAHATYPGRPGLIVFSLITVPDGGEPTGGLYAIRTGDEHPRQLTGNPRDYDPSFAPSGQKLVFRRVDTPEPGIYTLNVFSGKTVRLTSQESDLSPAFGPDGTVVFSRFVKGSDYDLFLRTSRGHLRRLTSSAAKDEEPVFTPDGERIVFCRDYTRAVLLDARRERPPRARRLFSIRTDGTGQHPIQHTPQGFDFDISPDGRHMAFAGVGGISYSPDGRRTAYADREGLWSRRADGEGKPTIVLEGDYDDDERQLLIQPAWQPLP